MYHILKALCGPPVETEEPLSPSSADAADSGPASKIIQNDSERQTIARPIVVFFIDIHQAAAPIGTGYRVTSDQGTSDTVRHCLEDPVLACLQVQGDKIALFHGLSPIPRAGQLR